MSAKGSPVEIWEIRTEEQPYAFLTESEAGGNNRYGQKIDLIDVTDHTASAGRSLNINDNPEVGCNPNRNKQHGFYFNADNCIGCHACEAACAEKNETPAHLSFRSVGYVEGGTYPDFRRMNISMACNHCDDPVCLKGCPTGAYTKHAEYGAVLQDPDTCFGCGYCTWVCPYNAPQLDPVEGQVSKCNMCVDRLEFGLKPSCVSACVGNALDFGVIEDVPENRFQAETSIPGFPTPDITHPNVRFQQTKSLPDEMRRTDSTPVKYYKGKSGQYTPKIDRKSGDKRSWNIARLSSRENPLVMFTLLTQAAVGTTVLSVTGVQANIPGLIQLQAQWFYPALLFVALTLALLGLLMSATHLGKPMRFYRGFNNLRYSPLSREALAISLFTGFLGIQFLAVLLANHDAQSLIPWMSKFRESLLFISISSGWLAASAGVTGLYYMIRCYQIPARPFWNHWQVATSFAGNAISLGALIIGTFVLLSGLLRSGSLNAQTIHPVAATIFGGVLLESLGLYAHHLTMAAADHEGGASHYVQRTTYGKSYFTRNLVLGASILLAGLLMTAQLDSQLTATLFALLSITLLTTSITGRALFYILVIPTTMPGAFFWKNKSFEEHARDIGLADNLAVGVAPLH